MQRWLVLLLIVIAADATAAPSALPLGHWEDRSAGLEPFCVDVVADHGLRLTFYDGEAEGWKPILVTGIYRVTASKGSEVHVEMTVEDIRRKGVSRCREHVVDDRLEVVTQLGAELRRGSKLRLTFRFACGADVEEVQVCLHSRGADGAPSVTCRTPKGTRKCTAGPSIDGALINAPAAKLPSPNARAQTPTTDAAPAPTHAPTPAQ